MRKKRKADQKRLGKQLRGFQPRWFRLRWFVSLLIVFLVFYFVEQRDLEEIKPDTPPVLYATVCHDNLETLFTEAIEKAKHSIFLVMYSLSDERVIKALNEQAQRGVAVCVMHDLSTHQTGFQKLVPKIENKGIKQGGLMHQKILIVDEEKVWIGSANWTTESLKLHDNLVVGLIDRGFAKGILNGKPFMSLNSGSQQIEYWDLPTMGKEGLERLIELMDGAQKTIKVAMFTWTHPDLATAAIRAHQRGVEVQIVHDLGQANGICSKTVMRLVKAGIPVKISSGLGLLHHKFAWIDENFLVNGSANWTRSAFTKNRDCFLILHRLTPLQNAKLKVLWERTYLLAHEENPLFLQEAA
jgi:cardiolipin synthase A/B